MPNIENAPATATRDRVGAVARWTARVLGLAVLGLYLTIFIGAGGVDPRRLRADEATQMLLFLTACAGLVVAWRRVALGGALTLVALLLFYLNEHRLAGRFPRGWGFAILAPPALLFLASAWRRHDCPPLAATWGGPGL